MKIILFSLLFSLACTTCLPQSNELQKAYIKAIQAQQNGDYAVFYDLIMEAYSLNPNHQGVLYQAGIAAALNNKKAEAIKYLKEAVLIQADFTLRIPELQSLKSEPAFKALLKLQEEASKTIIQSDTALVIKDRSLHAESVAAGEAEGIFYLGSIHKRKIVKADHGNISDFTTEGQDGLGSVFGLKVDKRRGVLWACASPMPEMKNYNAILPSGVFRYDLKSGRLLKKFLPENPSLDLVLGDLAISRKGDVYASDSRNNFIFRVNESNGKLEQFFSSEEFSNIQGITCSDDGRYLFIADYSRGIFRLDVERRWLTMLTRSVDLSLKGIDGLSFYDNSLIAIQNGVKPMRVTRYMLNKEQDEVVSFSIIDRGHPAFNEPTLGCVSDDIFYYVANSQWGGYDDDHHIRPVAQLQEIVVLKTNLAR